MMTKNKYGPKARETIEQTMDQFKKGKLRSGQSNRKVASRDQAVAIGIDEARRKGYKVPKNQ
jgi:hypothetical protein